MPVNEIEVQSKNDSITIKADVVKIVALADMTITIGEGVKVTTLEKAPNVTANAKDDAGNDLEGFVFEENDELEATEPSEPSPSPGPGSGGSDPVIERVSAISVEPKELTLTVGETGNITATVEPDDATNKDVTWSSSDEAIATVDNEGTVTAVAAGEATITVTTEDGNLTATTSVTVEEVDETALAGKYSVNKDYTFDEATYRQMMEDAAHNESYINTMVAHNIFITENQIGKDLEVASQDGTNIVLSGSLQGYKDVPAYGAGPYYLAKMSVEVPSNLELEDGQRAGNYVVENGRITYTSMYKEGETKTVVVEWTDEVTIRYSVDTSAVTFILPVDER